MNFDLCLTITKKAKNYVQRVLSASHVWGLVSSFWKGLSILCLLTHGMSKLNASKIKDRKDYRSKRFQMYGFVQIVAKNRPYHVCHDFIILLFFYFSGPTWGSWGPGLTLESRVPLCRYAGGTHCLNSVVPRLIFVL